MAPSEIQPFLRKLLDASAEAGKQVIVISRQPGSQINYLAADSIWRMWRNTVGGHTRIAKVEADLDSGETAYDLVKRGEPDAWPLSANNCVKINSPSASFVACVNGITTKSKKWWCHQVATVMRPRGSESDMPSR